MSEREIRSVLEKFIKDVDEGKVRTIIRRLNLKKVLAPPLVGLTLGMGTVGCSDDGQPTDAGTDVTDVGGYPDYAAPLDTLPIDMPKDTGSVSDYAAVIDMPKDTGSVSDYAAVIDMPKDTINYGDYTAPFPDGQ